VSARERLSSKEMQTSSHDKLFDSLMTDFDAILKKDKLNYDDYAVINVSPSVVPNPYLPSFRIFWYNITDGDSGVVRRKRKHGHDHGPPGDKECKKARHKDTWKCHLNAPWHSDPEAPARKNALWSPLGYAQVCNTLIYL
jgi:endopolyphosphatase